ncbi:cysteine hydrolase family protein [Neptunomonas phycophila]|uniref:Cysteine hydrolase family protein n=1 Tax=Neptunomonas phycophila TaxID=1572645 RepID=A0AAW7XGC7_9GAMM|nr:MULTISPECIES: cysteine hydrolase family protein [Neptunomonas]MBT3145688.1 cysteine hydrolase [Neptunomonas phycophila]MDN2660180.1 cysteine hydrolase family protein [Neptunomonas sp. CHC150]MDO6453205.1 cysteine hydrolase family protein [Neptunomonas phycophila]MDO6784352.1 cysteine hydrolase family protein [Neptunomonas phycophila]MDP2522945.1 cysteine hydrolase family protein [Neptunomonas phycophila]
MSKTALLIIDMQNDYFPAGKYPLSGIEAAANNVHKVLVHFRENQQPIIHVRHEFTSPEAPFFIAGSEGSRIYHSLQPKEGEFDILKHEVNSFKETDLQALLDQEQITDLVIVGAMSHMCIDAVARAAADLGYNNTVLHDACATLDLEFNGTHVPAKQVHAAQMAALAFAYAEVIDTETFTANA